MNPLWLGIFIALIGGVGALVLKTRNEKFKNSDAAKEAHSMTQAFADKALASDETLLLSDYSPSMKAHVVLSNKGIHYKQEKRSGEVRFDATYSDIKKCDFLDFTSNKVKSSGNVVHIKITSEHGNCTLYSFPKAKEIALELANRGFEKRSLL